MPGKSFLPYTDAELLQWASALSAQVSAAPDHFGIDVDRAADLASAVSGYSSALATASNESTRTHGAVAHKNDQRQSLREQARVVAALVRAHPSITAEQLSDLSLTIHKTTRTPRSAPPLAPLIKKLSVIGREAKFLLADAASPNAPPRLANNAKGATILSYVGATPPPVGHAGWKLEMQTAKTRFTVRFADDVSPATPRWIAARWYSRRGEYSPASPPIRVYLQCGATFAASALAQSMRGANARTPAA